MFCFNINKRISVILFSLIVSACGGGGGGLSSSTDSSSTAGTSSSSFWTANQFEYFSGHLTEQVSQVVGGLPIVISAMSTLTPTGNDTANGVYSASTLQIEMVGTAPGIYTIVPNNATLFGNG